MRSATRLPSPPIVAGLPPVVVAGLPPSLWPVSRPSHTPPTAGLPERLLSRNQQQSRRHPAQETFGRNHGGVGRPRRTTNDAEPQSADKESDGDFNAVQFDPSGAAWPSDSRTRKSSAREF